MQSDALATLLYVTGSSRLPGLPYDEYQTVETISDGSATGVFGSVPVPEPSGVALAGLGMAAAWFWRRRK